MGLPARATATPKTMELMVWAGANLGSYAMASDALQVLSGLEISDRRVRLQIEKIGSVRIAEREAAIEELKQLTLVQRRTGNATVAAPSLAVVMMDGGRYQRRDHFGDADEADAADSTHWRESKVGCLLSMQSAVHLTDPAPLIPDCFAHASVVRELAKTSVKQESSDESKWTDEDLLNGPDALSAVDWKPPKLLNREVVASGKASQAFGFHLESRAWRLNFPSASRQAFVADGAKTNWRIQREHFPRATPIADLIHALSYVWAAALTAGTKTTYQAWAQLIWQGDVAQVMSQLEQHQSPAKDTTGESSDTVTEDPTDSVTRCLTYLSNNASHMNYPLYRQQGLPITSSHMESTIKPINRRIKGTEKFWLVETSECVLQLRADYLSQSQPMIKFWKRWQAEQNGSNAYKTAC